MGSSAASVAAEIGSETGSDAGSGSEIGSDTGSEVGSTTAETGSASDGLSFRGVDAFEDAFEAPLPISFINNQLPSVRFKDGTN